MTTPVKINPKVLEQLEAAAEAFTEGIYLCNRDAVPPEVVAALVAAEQAIDALTAAIKAAEPPEDPCLLLVEHDAAEEWAWFSIARADGRNVADVGITSDSPAEIRELAEAILARKPYSGLRCGTYPYRDGWVLESPRNSGMVLYPRTYDQENMDQLARAILERVSAGKKVAP